MASVVDDSDRAEVPLKSGPKAPKTDGSRLAVGGIVAPTGMKRYGYIPFAGSFGNLKGPELAGLKEVSQGWYVEYSEVLPPVPQLARQLSAFANQSGGWLFIGVKGRDKGEMEAYSFPGIPAGITQEALTHLHEAASAHVAPEVQFEAQVIEGPVPEIDLAPGQCIIIVGIPEGAEPPYVHSSGRVYRRPGDHSGPEAELDRKELEELRSKAKETQQRLASFLSLDPAMGKREKDGPVRVYVYLLNDPFIAGESLGLPQERFADIMRLEPVGDMIAPGFENLFTTSDGYIARRVEGKDLLSEAPAFRWWANGNTRVSLPVDTCDVSRFPLRADPRRSDFVRMLRGQALGEPRIADFSELLPLLAAAIGKYLELRHSLAISGAFWAKVRFCDAGRALPFISLRQYIESLKVYGFPVIQDNDFYAPGGLSTDDLIRLEPGEYGGIRGQSVVLALRLAVNALRAVGIDFDRFIKDDPQGFLRDLAESMNFVVEEPPGPGES